MRPLTSPGTASRTEDYSTVRSPLAMDDVTFRSLGHQLVDTMAAYLDMLPTEPVTAPCQGRAFLAGTDIRGRSALRSCALHYALDEGHVQAIVDAARDTGHRRARAGTQPEPGIAMTDPTPHRAGAEENARCES